MAIRWIAEATCDLCSESTPVRLELNRPNKIEVVTQPNGWPNGWHIFERSDDDSMRDVNDASSGYMVVYCPEHK